MTDIKLDNYFVAIRQNLYKKLNNQTKHGVVMEFGKFPSIDVLSGKRFDELPCAISLTGIL